VDGIREEAFSISVKNLRMKMGWQEVFDKTSNPNIASSKKTRYAFIIQGNIC